MTWDPKAPGSTSQPDNQGGASTIFYSDYAYAQGAGPVVKSPNGSQWRITVSDAGVVGAVSVP